MPIRGAWRDFGEAASHFSLPARRLLEGEALLWTGAGVAQVLFNLYLAQSGFPTAVIGRAVSMMGLGVALGTIPASVLAGRWGRRPLILSGIVIDGLGQLLRLLTVWTPLVYGSSMLMGMGQSMLGVAAAPFMTEHSTPRERTHLFTAFFALALVAGVVGSLLGGWLPRALTALPGLHALGLAPSYRLTLAIGALISLTGALVFSRFRDEEVRHTSGPLFEPIPPPLRRVFRPVAVNALLIGAGAGLVIPFMNLYFAQRFNCSSAQIGSFYSVAQVLTAAAAMLGPALARRFGKLRTSVVAQLASLPFLVTLGVENRLSVAVAAFLARATLMQASTPLLNTFIMEALPAKLRATATGMINLLWNVGWAVSATLAGAAIERWGYGPTFATTATLYASAALYFYLSFRGSHEGGEAPRLTQEVSGQRADVP